MERADRTLIIIGGAEDRSNDKLILGEVARRVGAGKLVVSTVAMSNETHELFEVYEKAFRSLGVRHVFHLDVSAREEAKMESKLRNLGRRDRRLLHRW